MNIIETEIFDIGEDNIDTTKINLADKIINNVGPLFDEVFKEKVQKLEQAKLLLESKRKQVLDSKDKMEFLFSEQKRKQKVKKLLDRLRQLVNHGLIEGTSKSETIVLLKIIDKLPDDKLDFHLRETMKMITKKLG